MGAGTKLTGGGAGSKLAAESRPGGTGGAGITGITSTGGTIIVTNPGGPTTNIEVASLIAEPDKQIVYGTGPGVDSAADFIFDYNNNAVGLGSPSPALDATVGIYQQTIMGDTTGGASDQRIGMLNLARANAGGSFPYLGAVNGWAVGTFVAVQTKLTEILFTGNETANANSDMGRIYFSTRIQTGGVIGTNPTFALRQNVLLDEYCNTLVCAAGTGAGIRYSTDVDGFLYLPLVSGYKAAGGPAPRKGGGAVAFDATSTYVYCSGDYSAAGGTIDGKWRKPNEDLRVSYQEKSVNTTVQNGDTVTVLRTGTPTSYTLIPPAYYEQGKVHVVKNNTGASISIIPYGAGAPGFGTLDGSGGTQTLANGASLMIVTGLLDTGFNIINYETLFSNDLGRMYGTLPAGASIWNGIANPTGNMSLSMGSFTSAITHGAATGASDLFTIDDTANNTGTGFVVTVGTAANSTANPFAVKAGGTNVFSFDRTGIATFTKKLQFAGSTSGTIGLQVAAITANFTYTLPSAGPSGNTKVLGSTSGGVMSWGGLSVEELTFPTSGANNTSMAVSKQWTVTRASGTSTNSMIYILDTSTATDATQSAFQVRSDHSTHPLTAWTTVPVTRYGMRVTGATGFVYIGAFGSGFTEVAATDLDMPGTLQIRGSTSGYTRITAGTTPDSTTYTLPLTAPAVSGYHLTSTTGGVMSWVADSAAPNDAQYLVLTTDTTLTSERVMTISTANGLRATDAGAGGAYTLFNTLIEGLAGGQTVKGGTAASENLTLSSTTHATKGFIVASDIVKFPDGGAGPVLGWRFTSEATGARLVPGGGGIDFITGGTVMLALNANTATISGTRMYTGNVSSDAAPGFACTTDNNSGLVVAGGDVVGISTGGSRGFTQSLVGGVVKHGFFGAAVTAQATGGENVTNSVTDSGSTAGTIPDITDGVVYANDYTNLRRALFQLARMLRQDHDQLRATGFLS